MRLATDESGLSAVEYVIILVLLAIIGLVSWQLFGTSVSETVVDAHTEITALGVEGGMGATMGGGRASAGDDVEAVGEDSPMEPTAGEGGGEAGGGEGASEGGRRNPTEMRTQVAGVVQGEGSMSVYTAPEEEESDYSLVITFVLIFLGFFGAIFGFAKLREKTN
ncbi:MAG: hypothetical protein AAGE52_35910 [Myxococcota bacterium]